MEWQLLTMGFLGLLFLFMCFAFFVRKYLDELEERIDKLYRLNNLKLKPKIQGGEW